MTRTQGFLAICCIAAFFCGADAQTLGVKPAGAAVNDRRSALVIGNSGYKFSPLINPGNDARAMAAALRDSGFTVIEKRNLGQAAMRQAIREFGDELAKGGVGLVYYAGHGIQLRGRNYLVPVGADIQREDEIEDQSVDVNLVLQKFSAAKNALNILILDACRNNPFAGTMRSLPVGLASMDAPPGTLIAFSTAPGYAAADGNGDNGLYTEYLLKEMATREAKLEDIFKRVRLNVRRQSRGQQVPWESTSLEEDFYFLPPKQTRKLTEAELEKQFEEELGIWEKIKKSKDAAPVEDYLRRFPSGKFSELAQFRLDRVLAQLGEKPMQVASVTRAPATAEPSSLAQNLAKPVRATAEADRKRQEELARAEAELQKQQELAKAEAERKQQEEIARAEAERKKQDALARAEAERKRLEELARLDAERKKKEDLARAETERRQQEDLARAETELRKQQELAKAETDRKRQEELARAEAELRKQQELARAEAARKQREENARAEAERQRQDALAKAEAERKRLEELARLDAERKKKEDLARTETERGRQEDLARAETELRKQQELVKAETDRTRQEELARTEPVTAAPIAPIRVASIEPNHISRGATKVDANYTVGDQYSYKVIDTLTKLETRQFVNRITAVTDDEVIYGDGRQVTDLLGNQIKGSDGVQYAGQQFYVAEYSIGKKWTTRYRLTLPNGRPYDTEINFKVITREPITVSAGTFDAFKVEGRGHNIHGSRIFHFTYWIAPDQVRRPIVFESDTRDRRGTIFNTDRNELVAYRQDKIIRGEFK